MSTVHRNDALSLETKHAVESQISKLEFLFNNFQFRQQNICGYGEPKLDIKLEITIARKVLPCPQGIKGSMRNLMNKRLFSLLDPALQDEMFGGMISMY